MLVAPTSLLPEAPMPLIDHPKIKNKKIPDEKGGWYWLRLGTDPWKPIEVYPADNSGWPQGIHMDTRWVNAEDVNGEWGPQISPPFEPCQESVTIQFTKVSKIDGVCTTALEEWNHICKKYSIGSPKVDDELNPVLSQAIKEIDKILKGE